MLDDKLMKACAKARPGVTRILRLYPDSVDDVLQEACLKAHVNAGRFENRSAYTTWFTRIAINEALMFLRKQKARANTVTMGSLATTDSNDEVKEFDAPSRSTDLERQAIANQRRATLATLIKQLSPCQRNAVCEYLTRTPGRWTSAEKSRLFHARLNLKRKCREVGIVR